MTPASPIVQIKALGFPWATIDPFLFCAYHDDAYPVANAEMGPATSLASPGVRRTRPAGICSTMRKFSSVGLSRVTV